MEGFLNSLAPFFRRYWIESFLLTAAFALTVTSVTIYVYINSQIRDEEKSRRETVQQRVNKNEILMVEVSGAVKNAGVYELTVGSRLKDAIQMAGGLSDKADTVFFSRNFNLSRFLTDQEKFYIPTQQEIENDVFAARKQLLDYTSPQTITSPVSQTHTQLTISINTSSEEELDGLPGIGAATAAKIVQGRPYASLDELTVKKIINATVFGQIKNLISL